MTCSSCSKPVKFVFELLEEVSGVGPTKRHLCFPCVSELGEKVMKEKRVDALPTVQTEGPTYELDGNTKVVFVDASKHDVVVKIPSGSYGVYVKKIDTSPHLVIVEAPPLGRSYLRKPCQTWPHEADFSE